MNVVVLVTIAVGVVPCFTFWRMSWAMDVPEAYSVGEAIGAEACCRSGILLALALASVAGVLHAFVGRLTLRASTPLPRSHPDPLATYREGPPAECPRHPFAG
ncbi:MAG: hypothetical protein JWM10_104 [Myxococcaceae bacterium]|nr:hypothetical protein [Myxococcaceae bacterium]